MRSCMMFYYIFFTKGIQSLQKQRVTCMFFFFQTNTCLSPRKDAIYALFVRWATLLIS